VPFIHIKSLPFEHELDISRVIQQITDDFSIAAGIGKEHITVTWCFIPAGQYAVAGQAAQCQSASGHPLIVDLLVPDFNTSETIELFIQETAKSISQHTQLPLDNIFINCSLARSGRVFDSGEMVHW
jgi:phenylpyruvate tautomerase PptA (4-oxalocrotonate tautomerase family)